MIYSFSCKMLPKQKKEIVKGNPPPTGLYKTGHSYATSFFNGIQHPATHWTCHSAPKNLKMFSYCSS
jgi:hypothetical protein